MNFLDIEGQPHLWITLIYFAIPGSISGTVVQSPLLACLCDAIIHDHQSVTIHTFAPQECLCLPPLFIELTPKYVEVILTDFDLSFDSNIEH